MPTKYEIAAYLVNLNTLMDSQRAIGVNPSAALGSDYAAEWIKLKQAINQERADEARTSDDIRSSGSEAGTNPSRSQSSRRV